MTDEKQVRFRFDMSMQVLGRDEKTHTLRVKFFPNPARYEWRTIDDKRMLYDRLDDCFFPESVLDHFAKQLEGQPINFEPAQIRDASKYVQGRRKAILRRLRGNAPGPTFQDPSDDFLRELPSGPHEFVILSLDLVGSTKRAATDQREDYARAVSALLFEISEIVSLFRGHVLKYTGDGIIAYFPAPSFITKNDLALDCALTLRKLLINYQPEAYTPAIAIKVTGKGEIKKAGGDD